MLYCVNGGREEGEEEGGMLGVGAGQHFILEHNLRDVVVNI